MLYSANMQNIQILDCAHFGFMTYLFIIAILSKNSTILFLNTLMTLTVLYSRYYYQKCILSKYQKGKGFWYQLVGKLGIRGVITDIIIFLILILSAVRFIYYAQYR